MTELRNVHDVVKASTSDLVAWYNAHSGKSAITKFSDRKTAEKRVAAMLMGQEAIRQPDPAPKPVAPAPSNVKPAPKPAPVKNAVSTVEMRQKMSEAQRESWKDTEIRDKRCERSAVNVDGEDYRSVRAAFEDLGLPMGEHIKFRMELKEAGKLVAYEHTWEIIPLNY